MDLAELISEAATLHGAMCLVSRMARERERASPAKAPALSYRDRV